MPAITFLPTGVEIESQAGETIFDASRRAGLTVEVPCGGKGICKKCVVQVLSGDIVREDNPLLDKAMLDAGYVMACRTTISGTSPVSVRLHSNVERELGAFSEQSEDMLLIDQSLIPSASDIEPMVSVIAVTPALPVAGDGLSDYDRFMNAFRDALSVKSSYVTLNVDLPLRLLRVLPEIIRENPTVQVAYTDQSGQISIVDITSAQDDSSDSASSVRLGAALDIGTTTVALQLVDLEKGMIVASKTEYNGQIACGLDVISRINYAQKPERLEDLRRKILKTINRLLDDLAEETNADIKSIYDMTIAANTTMVHLLLGIPPENIRLDPYTPTINYVPYYKAGEIGINICPDAPVLIAPSVGSYVGGDITTGLLCTQIAYGSDDIYLFLDIGTNGELILGNSEFLLGCACSAGPAFEGGGITQGMRASMGAIERVSVDDNSGLATYSVIGGEDPIGICGSGMISLVASLMRSGWIDSAGQLDRDRPCQAIEVSGRNATYVIEPDAAKRVAISENDIQNLIRAKAAIFSACYLLLQNIDLSFDDLSGMVIAGGFGRYLDIDDATTIGLLPKAVYDKVRFQGNTSVSGAHLALISKRHRQLLDETARRITYIDLSSDLGYMDQYGAALFLPHTDASLFR